MNVTITVIVPIYNVEKYLVECLESIASQTIAFDEVILINDGSTDKSLLICEKYVSKYSYFNLINQKNQGPSSARNQGLKHMTKEYVMFLDSDDFLRADTVETLKNILNKYKYDVIYFDADIYGEENYTIKKNIYDRNLAFLERTRISGQEFLIKSYPENHVVSVCMAVFRKKVIDDLRLYFPEGLFYEDNYFSFVFITQAKDVMYIAEHLYQRRYRESSITTGKYSEKKFADLIKIISLIFKEIEKNNFYKDSIEWINTIICLVNNYFKAVLNDYKMCEKQQIVIDRKTQKSFGCMIEQYELLIGYCLKENKLENLVLLNKTLKNISEISCYYTGNEIYVKELTKKITEKRKKNYKNLLQELPLNLKKYKIGIYGTGNHTKGLISIYKDLIGDILCDLFFLDTYKENGIYEGKSIINYREVDESFDMIIISSFVFEKEMLRNIKNINKEIPVYTFYKTLKEDVFSGCDLL